MKPERKEECNCCESGVPPTPGIIYNRPGLTQLIYRVGTYSSFRLSMIEAIAESPELKGWTNRQSDDYGIALIEMWAYIADILTFYQERIANEAFLRTAVNRDTLIKLASMLDYKLNPGKAAVTYLSFTAEHDKKVKIPTGLRAQSVPGQNEKPQKFETVESILAVDKLNEIRVFPEPQLYDPFEKNSIGGILTSISSKISPGDSIVLIDPAFIETKTISGVSSQDDNDYLSWSPKIGYSKFQQFSTRIFPFDHKFHLFGYNAAENYMEPSTANDGTIQWSLRKAPDDYDFSLETPTPFSFFLDAVYEKLKSNSNMLLIGSGNDSNKLCTRIAAIKELRTDSNQLGPLQGTVTKISFDMKMTAEPVVILDRSGCIQVFTIGDDNALWTIKQSTANNGWDGWVSLGGQIDMIAAGKNKDGRLEVFARGMDKALWHIWQIAPDYGWSSWASLGGRVDLIAIGKNKDGRLEVFARGTDKALWHLWQLAPNDGWSGWASMGGLIDMLAVGNNKDGRLEVFVRGIDKALWHKWQLAPNDGWSGWASMGGLIDMLAVGNNEDGRLEVFVRGIDKALWHKWQLAPNNGWSGWASMGGLIDILAVGNNEDGRLEVFARGIDKALWHKWQLAPNDGWSSWASLDGQIDMLGLGNNQDGRFEIFARGTDKALWHIWQTDPNDGWSSWRSLGVPMWRIPDLRKVLIYELTGPQISLWNRYYPGSISGNVIYARLDQIEKIEKDRVLIIDDKNIKPEVIIVSKTEEVDSDGDGENDHLAISLVSSLSRQFDSLSSQISGNICKATHGETISDEILGNGDASKEFQEFSLKKSPITYLPSASTSTGTQSTLEIRIGGVLWKEVKSMYGQKSEDKTYITMIDDNGKMTVRFGDGVTGARLPSGRDNIIAGYRKGLGSEGNVSSDSITTLIDRPVGLKEVTNPIEAEGGTDSESMSDARKNAPNTVRTFERAVSLHDYEDLANSYTGIAKAKAVKIFENENEMIQLTIAGTNGRRIENNSLTYKNFTDYLDLHRDVNHQLAVISHDNEYLKIKMNITVDKDYLTEDVASAVKTNVLNFFAFENLELGQPIHLSDIYAVIHLEKGVTAVLINYFDYKTSIPPSLNVHLRINQNSIASLNEADLVILTDLT